MKVYDVLVKRNRCLRLTDEAFAELTRIANHRGMTLSAYLERLLRESIERRAKRKPTKEK